MLSLEEHLACVTGNGYLRIGSNDESPVIQAILEGGVGEVDIDDVVIN
jgi:hypothetical protein